MTVNQDTWKVRKNNTVSEYCRRTPRSKSMYEEARKFMPGGDTRSVTYFPPYPVFMESAGGCYMKDIDGHVYLDLLSNYTAMVHGHAHPQIVEAVHQQFKKGNSYGAPCGIQTELARHLTERVPSIQHVRFCNSGNEATMNAIRVAKAFTGRKKLIKMEGGYHGSHDAALVSVAPLLEESGPEEAPYSVASTNGLFQGVVDDVVVVPFNNIEATGRIFDRHAKDLAAVIIEPIMGAAGMIPADRKYLQFLREITRSCGALLIFDEVVSFRLSYGGAQELYELKPDLTTLGKIIGGGFPIGAFGGRADIMALFDPSKGRVSHSGTFNGNSATMAGGLMSLHLLTRDEIARINGLGERLRDALRNVFTGLGIEVQVTGMGSVLQVHFTRNPVNDYRSTVSSRSEYSSWLHLSLLNLGMFIAGRGMVCISTAMGEKQVAEAIQGFRAAAEQLQS